MDSEVETTLANVSLANRQAGGKLSPMECISFKLVMYISAPEYSTVHNKDKTKIKNSWVRSK